MKKKMAMTVMALAVSAMAGSAFAANEPTKITGISAPLNTVNTDGTKTLFKPIMSLEEMAKEKGISVEELIKQLEKEGKLTKGTATLTKDGDLTTSTMNLEEMAKEKGISVEELIEQLEKEGKLTKATATSNTDGTIQGFAVMSLDPENKDGGAFIALNSAMNLEEMAKEKGISVEELIEQLEKEGKLTKATATSNTDGTIQGFAVMSLDPENKDSGAFIALNSAMNLEEMAKEKGISIEELIKQLSTTTINLEEVAKEKGISVEELIKQLEKEGKITRAETAPASQK